MAGRKEAVPIAPHTKKRSWRRRKMERQVMGGGGEGGNDKEASLLLWKPDRDSFIDVRMIRTL